MVLISAKWVKYCVITISIVLGTHVSSHAATDNDWHLTVLDSLRAEGHRDSAFTLLMANLETVQKEANTLTKITYLTRIGAWHKALGAPAEGETYHRQALDLGRTRKKKGS